MTEKKDIKKRFRYSFRSAWSCRSRCRSAMESFSSTKCPSQRIHSETSGSTRRQGFLIQPAPKCGLCVRACPYETLKLAKFGDIAAPGTPYFEPREIPCYMCRDLPCVKACPSGALDPDLTDITKAKMGIAAIDHSTCLSWQGLRCEICYRDCPEQNKAIIIDTQPRQISKHGMFLPVIQPDQCTGCGLCVHSCPTTVPCINIVDPDKFLGRDRRSLSSRLEKKLMMPDLFLTVQCLGEGPTHELPPGGLDYLNSEGPNGK